MQIADTAYRAQQYKQSADLLRTAEHLSFASLHMAAKEAVVAELKQVIQEEFDQLIERSGKRPSRHEIPQVLVALLNRMKSDGESAMRRGSYRCALELARGAEALAHVHGLSGDTLSAPTAQKRLRA